MYAIYKDGLILGCVGLVSAEWAPDGRTVVCFSEWGVGFVIRSNSFVSS